MSKLSENVASVLEAGHSSELRPQHTMNKYCYGEGP